MGTVTVIENSDDDLKFERAFIAEENGYLVPRAIVSGVLCNIDTCPGPLADGIAHCGKVHWTGLQDWPMAVIVEKEYAWGGTYKETMHDCTANPKIVAAARHWAELVASGKAKAGMEL